jgi:hypothetical protein
MITASYILETYKSSFTSVVTKKYVEIFSNPTPRELHDLGEEIRFTADVVTKTIYVWNANFAIHDEVNKRLGYGDNWIDKNLLVGLAVKSGSSYRFKDCEILKFYRAVDQYDSACEILQQDWDWVEKYIQAKSYIRRLKQRFSCD